MMTNYDGNIRNYGKKKRLEYVSAVLREAV